MPISIGPMVALPASSRSSLADAHKTIEARLGAPSILLNAAGGNDPKVTVTPDRAFETIAAEDILHDLGAFSIISSDSQAMGRVGEVLIRTWQTADKMRR